MKKLLLPLLMTTLFFYGLAAQTHATPKNSSQVEAVSHAYKLNLNTATVEQLQDLKGIGLKKAQAIIKYRSAHGNFSSVDELSKVKGIGVKMVAKLESEVSVDE